MQTNGTLINQEWCDFFKKYNFGIGVSLDGPENIFSKNRFYANKKSAFNNVIHGIELLKKNSIPFGVLSVISNDTYDKSKEIFDFFKDLKVDSVDFIPSYLPVSDINNLDPILWGDFL